MTLQAPNNPPSNSDMNTASGSPTNAIPRPPSGDAGSSPITSSLRSSMGDMEGWVWVKRKTVERKRRRYLKISGSVMTCQKKKKTSIEWDASLLACRVRASPKRGSLMISFVNGTKAYITVDPKQNCKAWVECIKVGSSHKFEDLYEIHEKIGEGGFAKVHCGKDKTTGEKVAIKVIKKNIYDMQAMSELEREMQIMKSLDHPRIIKTHDVFHVQDRAYIVMELMHGGTLKDRIQSVGGTIPELQARDIIREVLEACVYLHANDVVHRDIKLENVLCKGNQMPQQDTKLADFGYVNFLHHSGRDSLRSLVGTPLYVATEIIERRPYGAAVDIYACGVMVYRMLAGVYPYNAENDEKTMQLALEGRLTFPHNPWSSISPECISFLKSLLNRNPRRRLTAAAALVHPWLTPTKPTKPRPLEKSRSSFSKKISRFGQRISTVTTKNQDAKDSPQKGTTAQKGTAAGAPSSVEPAKNVADRLRGREALRARILATIFTIRIGVACGLRPPPKPISTSTKSNNTILAVAPDADSDADGDTGNIGRRMIEAVRSLSLQLGQKTAEGFMAVRNRMASLTNSPTSVNRPQRNETTDRPIGPQPQNVRMSVRSEPGLSGRGKKMKGVVRSLSTHVGHKTASGTTAVRLRLGNNAQDGDQECPPEKPGAQETTPSAKQPASRKKSPTKV